MNIRYTKTGKPHASDLKRAKAAIKKDFQQLDINDLPKELKGYYNQVASGHRRGEANKKRERDNNGHFYNAAQSKAIREQLKIAANDTGTTPEEIRQNKQAFDALKTFALSKRIEIFKNSSATKDIVKRAADNQIILNGKPATKEGILNLIARVEKNCTELISAFDFSYKITYDAQGQILLNINPDLADEEDEENLIYEIKESENFNAYRS